MKTYRLFPAVVVLALCAAGCATAEPGWAGERPPAGEIWGIGTAAGANQALRDTVAHSRALRSLALQLDRIARRALADWLRQEGRGGEAAALADAAPRYGDMRLELTEVLRSETGPDGSRWVRVRISATGAERAIMEALPRIAGTIETIDFETIGAEPCRAILRQRLARRAGPPLITGGTVSAEEIP